MFRKLGWQLVTSFFVIILFSVGILGFFLLQRLDDMLTRELHNSIHHEAQLVASLWAQYAESDNLGQRQKRIIYMFCKRLVWQSGSHIRVVDPRGQVVMDTHADNQESLRNRPEIREALDGEEATVIIPPATPGAPAQIAKAVPIRVWKPSKSGSRETIGGAVYIQRSEEPLRRLLHNLRFDFLVGTLIALILSGFLGILLARLLSAPLRTMAVAAERMAEGDLSQMVTVTSSNEIGELARRFNHMAAKLRSSTDALMNEKNKLATVLAHLRGGVLLLDVDGQVLVKNQTALDLLGLAAENPPEDAQVLRDIVLRVIQSGGADTSQWRLPQERTAQLAWAPLHTEQGDVAGYVVVMNDITELRRLDEMKTEFVTNVSHELRTPLASIKGLTELLLDGALRENEGERFLRNIDREVDRLTRLVKDLLDMSKIESGLMKFEVRPTHLGEQVENLLDRMRGRLQSSDVRVELHVAEDAAVAMADPDRIEQVFINLLDNAVRHSPTGGTVTVRIQRQGDFAHIEIRDQGGGIPQAELQRIFERFYRVDKHRSRFKGGTGLGLSIARQIVERLGGRIWAESDGPETRFYFTLPVASVASPAD